MSYPSRCFRRSYATIVNNARAARSAQASSAPLKVKERREQIAEGFPRTVDTLTREERRAIIRPFVVDENKRSKLRGVRIVRTPAGRKQEVIVGQRIYLPNIIFTLIRNHTLAGKPYNPYEATFRVPQYVTKTDVRSYLKTIYGVDCTYVRTDNYFASLKSRHPRARAAATAVKKAYKRAVVGLVKPFYYPLAVEDMDGKERWLREATLEDAFRINLTNQMRKWARANYLSSKESLDVKAVQGHTSRRRTQVLRRIWERKEERERATREVAQKLQELRTN